MNQQKPVKIILRRTVLVLALVLALVLLTGLWGKFAGKRAGKPPSPARGKLIISGVETADFLAAPLKIRQNGEVVIAEDKRYRIIYSPQEKNFLISLLGRPFARARAAAEAALLARLGIRQQEACRLPVIVATPYFANPAFAGRNYGLSFCPEK